MDISKSTVSITSYNAHAINDATNYVAKFPGGLPLMADNDPTYVERLDDYPVDSTTRLKSRALPLVVWTVAGTADTLKQWFNEGRSTKQKLIVTDSTDASAWYVYAKLKSFTKRAKSTNVYDIILSVADPIWRNNATTTLSWSVTSSGQTQNIDVTGTVYARPIITVSPQSARTGGYDYKKWLPIYNPTTTTFSNYPFNMLGGNLDHAALVTAGKAQADGDDFHVWWDGAEIDRWVGGGGWNSTTLRVWSNVNLSPKIEITIADTMASTGIVSTINFQQTMANRDALQRLDRAQNKILLIGSEAFVFTAVSPFLYKVTGCTRAQKGTTAASASAGDTARWIEHDAWIIYGLSTASAPTVDATKKPILDLTNSTNTSWVYTDYFDKANPSRSGSWAKAVIQSAGQNSPTPSGNYGANHATNADFTAIASEMGISGKAYQAISWRLNNVEIEWRLYSPAGFTTTTVSGEKYRATTSWPGTVALQKSTDGRNWTDVFVEATPSAATTWEALAAHSADALSATYNYLRFVMFGTIAGTANNLAHVEFDSLTFVPDSTTIPQLTTGAEQSQYYMSARIQNDTTGDYVDIAIPSALDAVVTINCDTKSVTLTDGTSIRAALTIPTIRQDWMTLDPVYGDSVDTANYTLYDRFSSRVAAGSLNGTSADVGGTRTVTDTNSKISIANINIISVTETGLASIAMSVAYEPRSL